MQVALLEEEKKLKAQASPERPPSSNVRARGRPTSERFVSTARLDAEKCMAARETASKVLTCPPPCTTTPHRHPALFAQTSLCTPRHLCSAAAPVTV